MLTDHFYRLHQEDAAEFLVSRLLDTEICPALAQLLTTLGADTLRCAKCGHARQSTRAVFHSFQVPIELEDAELGSSTAIQDVQTAFNAYLAAETVPYELACAQCGNHQYRKTFCATVFPEVLVLTLKRFKFVRLPSGACAGPYPVDHPVETREHLEFQGQSYRLRSVVVHVGASLDGGHYFTVARHDTNNGTWWLYNDGERREATPTQVSTVGLRTRRGEAMKSYVLFYEKCTAS